MGLLNHLILHLEDKRRVFISTIEVSDSQLCNIGGQMMGKEWDKSKVKVAQTSHSIASSGCQYTNCMASYHPADRILLVVEIL